jgi:diacylglycerol kinase
MFEFLFISLAVPIGLNYLHRYFQHKFKLQGHAAVHIMLIFSCIILLSLLDYQIWWNEGGRNLDSESKDVVRLSVFLQSLIAMVIGGILIYKDFPRTTKEN